LTSTQSPAAQNDDRTHPVTTRLFLASPCPQSPSAVLLAR
jgi:hypothetical protein